MHVLRTRIRIAITAIAAIALAAYGWHYYRWGDYSSRPLFFNEYRPNRDGIGPWHWHFEPGPIYDGTGRMLLLDFEDNMAAIVLFSRPTDRTIEGVAASPELCRFIIHDQTISLSKSPNSVIATKDNATFLTKTLAPGEAKRLYDQFMKKVDAGGGWDTVAKQEIDNLLQP